VFDLRVSKFWGEKVGITVTIEEANLWKP
jgi:Holliday junction resolvase RusA-like endonuclease